MPTVQEELATLREWLQAEKEEGYEQFRNLIERMPLSERQKKGFSWYPVDIRKSGYTFGERAYVVLEFAAALDHPHQFRSGKPVRLFTQQAHVHRPEQNGVINYVQKGKMKIVLNTKDLPDWLGGGQIGVDLMFDERSYLEMEKALKLVMNAEKNRLAELRDILLGHRSPQLAPPHTVNNPILNQSQNRALQHILASKDVSIVHGPPGTGKTTTIVQAIRLLSQQESTLLVCAPSNTAVDLLSERLAAEGLRVVRVGNISRVDESLIEHTLDAQLAQHPESKNIKKIKIKAAECRRSARRYRRKFGSEERNAKRELLAEAKELTAWANQLEERLINQILDSAQVICCTLVSSTNKVLDRRHFRTLVIDEAAQALEPATWIPITKASKIILTGDPFQLPPTVKSIKAQKGGLEITLLEKCIQRFKKVNLLQVQYRMHQLIMGFSNQQFYDNQLIAADSVAQRTISFSQQSPILFIDTAGCGFDEKINPAFKSRYNPDEYNILREHLYQFLDSAGEEPLPSIAIISPYREQVRYILEGMEEDSRLKEVKISVDTVDGFQGQERDVIYISLVRSNEKGEIGFLKDIRRMNVAMTRARMQLVIIGDSACIGAHPFYEDFLKYCEAHDAYESAWTYMQ